MIMRLRPLCVAAALLLLSCGCVEEAAETRPPDMILVTIDTLRADALGFAGQRNVETPFLDDLARQSVVFTNAHAHNVITLPSHVNILTGLYPYQHGVRDNAGYTLDARFPTIAARLKEKGYATGAFVGAFPLDARHGLTPGFDVYDDDYPQGSGRLDFKIAERRAEQVLSAAAQWWRGQSQQPRFLWVHLYDPHVPYQPPAEFAPRYALQPYLGEVAYVDAMLGRYLRPLIAPETMVVVTADHGEALGDHGELTHGLFAYEATLKVPLLLRDPSTKARADARSARHIDIVPTLLERAGIAKPAELPGQSLLAKSADPQPAYFEALSASLNRGWAPLVGVIDRGFKYVDLPEPELYELARDPMETKNVVREQRRTTAELRKLLADSAPASVSGRGAVSPEQSAQLLSLGYITGASLKKSYTRADDPKNLVAIDNMLHRVVELYQTGQHDRAVSAAREVVRLQPDMPVAREMLAFMLQQVERSDAAVATLREAIARGTATEAMNIRLGLLLSERGEAREAVSILERHASKADVDVWNAYGIALADVGRPAEAVAQFRRVLELDRTNATAHQNLGIVALRQGRPQEAERHLNDALKLDAELPLALNTLAVLYAQSGRTREAIETWKRAVTLDPHLYDALFNLGITAGRNGQPDVAAKALQRFVETAPPRPYARELNAARQMLSTLDR